MPNKHYLAHYDNPHDANDAIDQLIKSGFAHDQISLMMTEETRDGTWAIETKSKALEGAATGGLAGGALGALLGGLTAIGGVALTGGAGLVAIGPLVAAMTGAGVGAGAGGGIGGLIGLGIPEHEIKHIEEKLQEGHALLAVECDTDDKKDAAQRIFDATSAEKVTSG